MHRHAGSALHALWIGIVDDVVRAVARHSGGHSAGHFLRRQAARRHEFVICHGQRQAPHVRRGDGSGKRTVEFLLDGRAENLGPRRVAADVRRERGVRRKCLLPFRADHKETVGVDELAYVAGCLQVERTAGDRQDSVGTARLDTGGTARVKARGDAGGVGRVVKVVALDERFHVDVRGAARDSDVVRAAGKRHVVGPEAAPGRTCGRDFHRAA